MTVWIQTVDGVAELVAANDFFNGGTNWVQFELDAGNQAIIDAIQSGDRYIFAVTRPAAGPQIDLAATGATGAVAGTATLTVTAAPPPGQINLEATGATGAVTGSATLTVTAATPGQVIPDYAGEIVRMDITANSTTEPLNEGGGSFTGDNRISSDLTVARIRHQDGQTLRFTSHSGDFGSFISEIAANGALRGLYVYWATAADAVVFQYGPITGNESAASFRLDVDFGETIDMPTAGALCYLVIGSNTPAGGGVEIDLAATGATGAVTGSATLTVTAAPPPGQINLAATGATGAVSGSATLTVTAGTPALTLADFDTTGLEVDAAALNVASADASPTPATFYADSDRGGTDAPLDGDIGVGPDDTPISRIRRTLSGSTERLGLNDNGAFDLGAYFDSGGDGNDLTVWIQTVAGIAEIVVADSTDSFGSNFIQFSLSTANQAIIDAIDLGDRYIFAVTRPAAGPQIDLAATGATGAVTGTQPSQSPRRRRLVKSTWPPRAQPAQCEARRHSPSRRSAGLTLKRQARRARSEAPPPSPSATFNPARKSTWQPRVARARLKARRR